MHTSSARSYLHNAHHMNKHTQQNKTTITIEIDPALSGQEIAEQATNAFFAILQAHADPEAKHDLGGFSSHNHDSQEDTLMWNAQRIYKDYENEILCSVNWITTQDVYLCYPNARPTRIKAGTQVERHEDGTFTTISTTGATPHTIPAEAVTKAE